MPDFATLSDTLQKGKAKEVGRLVAEALSEGAEAKAILEKGLIAARAMIRAGIQPLGTVKDDPHDIGKELVIARSAP